MILHINSKLNMWADWVTTGRKVVGLGYPSQVAFMRLTPCSNRLRAPIENETAWEIERAIHQLTPCLRDTIHQFYLQAGTVDTHAKALGIHRDTVYTRIHCAHLRIMEWLQVGDEDKNHLTQSDAFATKHVR
jgi:DNA-directed RNA polymerase specialized sigma24 family protein